MMRLNWAYFTRSYARAVRTTKRPQPTKVGKLKDDNDFNFSTPKRTQALELEQELPYDTPEMGLWLEAWKKPPEQPIEKRLEAIRQYFDQYRTYDKVSELKTDFASVFSPKLRQFGDVILKDLVEEDEQLKHVYDSDSPTYAYLLGSIHVLEGFDQSEVIRARMAVPRASIAEYEQAYEEFSQMLSEAQMAEETGHSVTEPLVETYLELPKPRAKHIVSEDFEDFLEYVGRHLPELDIETASGIYQDVLESGMMLTPKELKKWLMASLAQFRQFDKDTYEELKKGVAELGYPLNRDLYTLFLASCLNAGNFPLFEEIMGEAAKEMSEPNRDMLLLLDRYAGSSGQLSKWADTMELRMKYPHLMTSEDWECTIESLVSLGQSNLAQYMLNLLVQIQEGFKSLYLEELKATNQEEILQLDTSSPEFIPYEEPMKLFDLVADKQEPVMHYPQITCRMVMPLLAQSKGVKEVNKWMEWLEQHDVPLDQEFFQSVFFWLYSHKQKVPFKEFQRHVMYLMNNEDHEEYLDYLIGDEHNLRTVVAFAEDYIDAGSLDGDDGDVVAAVKLLWEYCDKLSEDADTTETEDIEAAKAVLALVKADPV